MDPASFTAASEQDAELLRTPQAQAILLALDERLKSVPQVAALETQLDHLVPGWKTSEFWITTLGQIGAIIAACAGAVPPKYAVAAVTLSQVAYALSRGLAKGGKSS